MGNCSKCTINESEDTLNNTMKISSDTIIGEYTKINQISSLCCCKSNLLSNQNLLDNIKLTNRQKKLFEKKISKFKTNSSKNSLNTNQNKNSNISINNSLFINELNFSPEKKYKIISNIGQGSYGNVFLATNIYTKEKVAIKKIYKSNDVISESEIINEIEILKKLNHPDIVKVLEFYKTDQAYYIVSEYCSGGELFEKAETYLSETQIAVIFKQILSGLSYLHSNNIVHRDLKLENILISDTEYVALTGEEYLDIKIIDFGNAEHFDKKLSNKNLVGSSYYIAPEIFKKIPGKQSDLWSAGVILYMLIVGHPPFYGESDKKILLNVKKGIYDKNYSRWKNASNEVQDLIEKLLISDPKKRLSAKEALNHPWFKKYQSNAIFYNITKKEIHQCILNFLSYNVSTKFQELVMSYIIHNMSKIKQTKIAISLFKLVNTNGDGKLLKNELKKVLLYFVSEEYLINYEIIFDLLDDDKKGFIEYEKFLRACLDKKYILNEENIKLAFNFFDKENKGYFDEEKMKNIFNKEKISDELCHIIFEEIDLNKNGKIDFQTFKIIMLN